jgi:aminoglycoside phosphotransferase (APT) family kinase protein
MLRGVTSPHGTIRLAGYRRARGAPTHSEMAIDAPSDSTLRAVVRGAGANAVAVIRRGDDVEVVLADGRELTLFFTDKAEVETWRRILDPAAIGPRLFGAGDGWLLVQRLHGAALARVDAPLPWDLAAEWLSRLHEHFEADAADLRARNPYLGDFGRSWFAVWSGRAVAALASSPDPRARRLLRVLEHYHRVTSALATLPPTLVHGDLHCGNVLVDVAARRVWARDWRRAAVGPGLIDLALLAADCDDLARARLLRAYRDVSSARVSAADLDRCRLHLALQAIGGRSSRRSPQAHDLIGEALALAESLDL